VERRVRGNDPNWDEFALHETRTYSGLTSTPSVVDNVRATSWTERVPVRHDRAGRPRHPARCLQIAWTPFVQGGMDPTQPGLIVAMPDEPGESKFWTVVPRGQATK
jgi:hypothetical protein